MNIQNNIHLLIATLGKTLNVQINTIRNFILAAIIGTFLAACSQTNLPPTPYTEPNPAEDPVFSTLDFATPQDDKGYDLALNGNDLYVVGGTRGNLDSTNQGSFDGILRRYNGGKLWSIQFGTRSYDEARKVVTDSNSNVYVMGKTSGPLGFQIGYTDTFLAKFNKDGEHMWIRQFGEKYNDSAIDLAIDSNNRIYVLSQESANSFVIRKFNTAGTLLKTKSVTLNNHPNFGPRAFTIDSSNNLIILADWDNSGANRGYDIMLLKYTSNLNQIWRKNYGTDNTDNAYDITTDSNNKIYFTLFTNALSQGGHFVKKNANGATLYTRRLEHNATSFNTGPKSVTTDSNDNIYIAGNTSGSFSGFSNAGLRDIVVFKYSSSGTQLWINQFDNGNYGSANHDLVEDIIVNDEVYITGSTLGNLLTGSATSYGGFDAYVAKLNKNNGNILGVDQ